MSEPAHGDTGEVWEDESWWQVFVHAMRGTGGDPTKGPVVRAIMLLAVPMVLEMAMESVFAVVDSSSSSRRRS